MDLKSILDTTNDNTFFDEVIRDYYDNRILILNKTENLLLFILIVVEEIALLLCNW